MNGQRIISFLPAATEMAYALGLGDRLVGRSHQCDYPPDAKAKPVMVRCAFDTEALGLAQIDAEVSQRLARGESIYAVDEALLRAAAPDLILAQDLCQVCAPSGNALTRMLATLDPRPEILWQTPHSFQDVLDCMLALGDKTGRGEEARRLVAEAQAKVDAVRAATSGLPRPRVAFLEWLDPIFCGGHWIPSLVGWGGGRDDLAREGVDSVRIPWEAVLEWDPEVLIVAPCGFGAKAALAQASLLRQRPGWRSLAAVRQDRVYAVDASAYFAKPGLRLADGACLLAHLFHPEVIAWRGSSDAFARVPV